MNYTDIALSLATNSTTFHASQACADWCSNYQQIFYHNQLMWMLMLPCIAYLFLQALWLLETYGGNYIPQIKEGHPFYNENIKIIRKMFQFMSRWMFLIYLLWIIYERYFGFLRPPPSMVI